MDQAEKGVEIRQKPSRNFKMLFFSEFNANIEFGERR